MPSSHIVVHYHELWLKGGNRNFFLHQLRQALRRALGGIAIARISRPGDRLILELADAASLEEALTCLEEDHQFLLKGDVFTEELLETFIEYKRKAEAEAVRLRPHPYEFSLYYDI